MKYSYIYFILSIFILSCSQETGIIIYINNAQVDCVGVAPQKCMQIKYHTTDDWQYFYDSIAGFEFTSGYYYMLKVAVQNIENPPADASSKKYILIDILETSESEIE